MGERLVRTVTRPVRGSLPVTAVEAGFRLLARVRRAPALHPQGLTCAADLDVADDGAGPCAAWPDTPARYVVTVGLSRAAGLPRRLPDGLGLALRVEQAFGPDRALDLLLTNSGRSRISRHLPLPRLGGPLQQPAPLPGGRPPPHAGRHSRRTGRAPVHGDPARQSDALAAGPHVFDLCAESPDGRGVRSPYWTVRTALD